MYLMFTMLFIGMVFNSEKFELLRFMPKQGDEIDFDYKAPNGNSIQEKACVRDLGVKVSTDLSFKTQIDCTVESASRMVSWALRTFRNRGTYLMLTVLRSLIQPRLDYCSQLWSPRDQTSINRLEAIQRKFINQIKAPELSRMNYWEKLSTKVIEML